MDVRPTQLSPLRKHDFFPLTLLLLLLECRSIGCIDRYSLPWQATEEAFPLARLFDSTPPHFTSKTRFPITPLARIMARGTPVITTVLLLPLLFYPGVETKALLKSLTINHVTHPRTLSASDQDEWNKYRVRDNEEAFDEMSVGSIVSAALGSWYHDYRHKFTIASGSESLAVVCSDQPIRKPLREKHAHLTITITVLGKSEADCNFQGKCDETVSQRIVELFRNARDPSNYPARRKGFSRREFTPAAVSTPRPPREACYCAGDERRESILRGGLPPGVNQPLGFSRWRGGEGSLRLFSQGLLSHLPRHHLPAAALHRRTAPDGERDCDNAEWLQALGDRFE